MTSDSQGKIAVEKLPPGHFTLVRHSDVSVTPDSTGWFNGGKTTFEIRAGETTTLDLGTSNYTVTAHLVWPAGMQRQPNWRPSGTIHTPVPEIPPDLQTNPASVKEKNQLMAQRFNAAYYPVTFNSDDTITADDVAAGDYQLSVNATSPVNAKNLPDGSGAIKFNGVIKIPVPTESMAGTFNAGDVKLEPETSSP